MFTKKIFELLGIPWRELSAENPKLIDQPEYDPHLDNSSEHDQHDDNSSSDDDE